MTTQTEALKLALDEIKRVKEICLCEVGIGLCNEVVIAKLEEALAQPEEKLHPVHIGVDVTKEGTAVTAFYRKPDAVMEMFYSQFHPMEQPEQEPVATLDDLEQEIYENTRQFVSRDVMEWMLNRLNTTPPQTKEPEQKPVAWRNAAIRVGEDLCSVGPFGYYDMTAEQWLDWALSVVTVHAPPPQRKPLTDEEIGAILEGVNAYGTRLYTFARAIEAKLKEKNT